MTDYRDIESRADIDQLLVGFYERLLGHDLMTPIFKEIDLGAHLPRIADFWESILFQRPTYSGSAFTAHEELVLTLEHFDIWLAEFESTLDSMFRGVLADQAKTRANAVASIFKSKMKLT